MNKKDTFGVLGFGSQGRAIALNLRDSGYKVIVGLRTKSKSTVFARRNKIPVTSVVNAAAEADQVIVALPDHIHGRVLNGKLFDRAAKRPAFIFLHGSSIHFGLVKPPADIPVLLLAPHAPGLAVRDNYLNKKPFSAFYAVYNGPKKKGYDLLVKTAKAIGIPRTHLLETSFAAEAVGDLFGEQAVLCGGLARLLKFGFETLVEAGISPQNAYLEVAFQLDLIVDLIREHGLSGMFDRISPLARYGSIVNGPKIVTGHTKTEMKRVLKEIASGRFIHEIERSGMKLTKKQIDELASRLFDRQVKRFRKI